METLETVFELIQVRRREVLCGTTVCHDVNLKQVFSWRKVFFLQRRSI